MRFRIAAIFTIIILIAGGLFYLANLAETRAPEQQEIRSEVSDG